VANLGGCRGAQGPPTSPNTIDTPFIFRGKKEEGREKGRRREGKRYPPKFQS